MTELGRSYFHRGGRIPLLGRTIPEHFSSVVRSFSEKEAIVSLHQGRRLTYGSLAEAVDCLARGLMALGVAKGDRVGIWSTNSVEWVLVQMATARIGAILVTINPAYRPGELVYALRRSQVQYLFTIPGFRSSDYIGMLAEVIPELKNRVPGQRISTEFPDLVRVILYDPSEAGQTQRPYPGLTLWAEVLEEAESVSEKDLNQRTRSLDPDDPINIQYTSGTTGTPKAVVLSHHNVLNNAFFSAQAMHLNEADRLCLPVPLYHCFGMVLGTLLSLSVGACVILPCEHFDAVSVLEGVDQERCTALHGVPTMFIAELEHEKFKEFNLKSLRTGIMAGAPCPPELMERVMTQMHCSEILIGYGQTEASPITHLTTREDTLERRTETVGRNLPHQEVKLIGTQTGKTVPLGQVGEICFRGYHVMKEYYGDPEATDATVDGSHWLHSGDLGTMDRDGYVKVTGRLKDMVIRGGENIYPREIEDFVFTHPKVAEIAVFGIPDDYYGEEIMAWIRLHPGEVATEEEIREFCRGKIAHYKIPNLIWFVEEFPVTVTGKLQKFRMREMAIEKMKELSFQ
jgi:fatty-acyl-CoA synthase